MVKIRLSPSKVETFRKYYAEELKGTVTEQDVIAALTGTTVWKPQMLFGSAFHKILEVDARAFYNPKTKLYTIQDSDMPEPVIMTQAEVDVANLYRRTYPHMVHEIKGRYRARILDYDVSINLRIDGMDGVVVHEKKTTGQFKGVESYERSVQWRFYALTTECRVVQYDIFIITEPKHGPREIEPFHFQFFPYAEMAVEVNRWILQLIRFAESRGLMDYLIVKENHAEIFGPA